MLTDLESTIRTVEEQPTERKSLDWSFRAVNEGGREGHWVLTVEVRQLTQGHTARARPDSSTE